MLKHTNQLLHITFILLVGFKYSTQLTDNNHIALVYAHYIIRSKAFNLSCVYTYIGLIVKLNGELVRVF